MSEIQVDMFEVQLGAAMLLQFKTKTGKAVRVLADAGVTAGGYKPDHVHRKLAGAFDVFGDKTPRLDLIIGTHYDADHLEGLVSIINDKNIDIGEAWMPPVANDTEVHAEEESIQEHHMLGYQLAGDRGEEVLAAYLRVKADVCEELKELERIADELQPDNRNVFREQFSLTEQGERERPDSITRFEEHIRDANATLGQLEDSHADEDIMSPPLASVNRERGLRPYIGDLLFLWRFPRWSDDNRQNYFRDVWKHNPASATAQARSMAYIRRAAARDAINATSLDKVIRSLTARKIPTLYRMTKDGQSRRFVWIEAEKRFMPGVQLRPDGPELLLLGPSEGLVKKHWDKLPLGNYLELLALKAVPVKSITASNQLSYVARLSAHKQGLLVCGDAGFVDFKPTRGEYYKTLLDALIPLHVIQVAHHGGNNAHFYDVLLKAGYADQTDSSLLLLSHASKDKYRPSKEFSLFIERVRKEGDGMRLLFTSQPTADKVKDYHQIIHPVVGQTNSTGDIRVQFDSGRWKVLSHAVRV